MSSTAIDPAEPLPGEPSQQQSRFWNGMVQLKAHIFNLGYHRRRFDRVDFWIKCVMAVTSSASIAVRNNVSHGIWGPEFLNSFVADRVIHAVHVIGLLRASGTDKQENHAQEEGGE